MVTITLALFWSGLVFMVVGAIFSILVHIFFSRSCGLEEVKRMVKLIDAGAALMGLGWAMFLLGGIPLLVMYIFSMR